ncbi:MAG: ferredoxin family protein [Chloroflexi bacterium]|nr:ferredoxin family protein [Chloroflexota bacterium]
MPEAKESDHENEATAANARPAAEKADTLPERVPAPRPGARIDHPDIATGTPEAEEEPQKPADAVVASPRKRPPSQIVVYRDWCKACGICIEFCPTRVLDRGNGGYPIVARPEKCVSCDLCELLCPDFAIMLTRPLGGQSDRQREG